MSKAKDNFRIDWLNEIKYFFSIFTTKYKRKFTLVNFENFIRERNMALSKVKNEFYLFLITNLFKRYQYQIPTIIYNTYFVQKSNIPMLVGISWLKNDLFLSLFQVSLLPDISSSNALRSTSYIEWKNLADTTEWVWVPPVLDQQICLYVLL